ncbi:MAG: type I-E CRISPR-associated endoribonuclease Cas2e [Streptosporangiaceae bacterium]
MIFLVLTAVPRGLRGDLSKWLLEVSPGVFTGRVSRRVRERIWARVEKGVKDGCAVLVVADHDREQGYEVLTAGVDRWVPVDFEGLTLMRKPVRGAAQSSPRLGGRKQEDEQMNDEDGTAGDEVAVTCLLVFGDEAELVLAGAEVDDPARWPAAVIAEEAGLQLQDLPGSRFRVKMTEVDGRVLFSDFRPLP